jgi:hypothetical protein
MLARGTYIDEDDFLHLLGPEDVLAMPFDVTEGKSTLQEVSARGEPIGGVTTHWSYWSERGEHLADVFICLGDGATVVVNPQRLQSQHANGNKVGPIIDLTGERGVTLVSTYVASPPQSCAVSLTDPDFDVVEKQLVGSWTIANHGTGVSFGGDPIGLQVTDLPDPSLLEDGPIRVQSLRAPALVDSEVILIALESSPESGNGLFLGTEFGPVPRGLGMPGNPRVCCNASFTDDLSNAISVPDVCFQGVGFRPLTANAAEVGETPIIPGSVTLSSAVTLRLEHCISRDGDGTQVPLGSGDFRQFLFVFHGHAVNPPTP